MIMNILNITRDLPALIATIGYVGVALIIFFENGVFFGFFLPGDSLLFTAGLLASQHLLNITYIIPSLLIAAILGYECGYWFGKYLSTWLMHRRESFFFKRRYLNNAQHFYARHGGLALIMGRFLPAVRTFVPIIAGMVGMNRGRYHFLNIIGAAIWTGGVTLLGFGLGSTIPGAEHYLLPLVLGIVFLSLSPLLWHWIRRS